MSLGWIILAVVVAAVIYAIYVYNRMVRLPHDGSYEELWRQDALYDLVGVLGWNDAPVQRGRGSAIFLHVARDDYGPTEGCVALALDDLQRVLTAGLTEVLVLPS